MEKSLDLDLCMREVFEMQEVDIREYSPLTLAYIGDGVYELIIRTLVVNKGNKQVNKLHQETSSLVKAEAQSAMMREIQLHLTEEEHAVYKRGRNSKSISVAKNQTVTDYRRATGFEALCGYLYLKKDMPRLLELIHIGLESISKGDKTNE